MKKKFLAAVMALVMIGTTPVGVFADTMVKKLPYRTGCSRIGRPGPPGSGYAE